MLQRAVVVVDFCKQHREGRDVSYEKAKSMMHDLAFSFLMIAMGEHIPKSLWSVGDYSDLYTLIDNAEELDVTDDQ
jgi:hypothetical protein